MTTTVDQAQARLAIFAWLDQKLEVKPWLTWQELVIGCPTQLGLIPLANSQGIWNPKQFDETLTIMTSTSGPYKDSWVDDAVMEYAYQGESGLSGNNSKLRQALHNSVPIIVLQRIEASIYVPRYPAYVTNDNQSKRIFTIDLSSSISLSPSEQAEAKLDKKYAESIVKTRLHQPRFRAQVLWAYESTCVICRLRHIELLDAAHIIPDSQEAGTASVRNGLALCKIHHSSYDANLIGISGDLKVHVRPELMHETDGPMLRYGIQEMNGQTILLPRSKKFFPDQDALQRRFHQYLNNNH